MGDRKKIGNMEEFAAVSGISRPTVSKYFNDPGSVRQSTRARIEAALEQYDYRPNIYAMNQNRRMTKTIGIVVPYLADPFFTEIARTIEMRCIEAGFRTILQSSHGDTQRETDNLENLLALKPAGVLLGPLGRSSDRTAVESFCAEVPTVLVDANLEGLGVGFVGSNNDQSIDLIVDYLCRSGEPPVFFEMAEPPNPNAIKRRRAYGNAMERVGCSPQYIRVEGRGWDFEEIGYRQGLRVIAERGLATNTVLCSNDRLAMGFLAAAYELGHRVGRGAGCALRVAGHDDHPLTRYTCPTLTTVSQDYVSIARASAETLLGVIESGDISESQGTTLFDGELIMRESA